MSIKDRWQKLEYWQKGGMLSGVFGLIWSYLYFFLGLYNSIEYSPFLLRLIVITVSSPMFLTIIFQNVISSGVIWSFFSFVSYFILGMSIGELYHEKKYGFKLSRGIISLLVLVGYFIFSAFFVFISYLN